MGKLLQRLSDASKSGVYRAAHGRDVVEALRGGDLALARVDLNGAGGKEALLERIAAALAFPAWFGGNWDALEDCLCDLSWSKAAGHVLLLENAADLPAGDRGLLLEVLAAAAEFWAGRGRPFFAVLVGEDPALPALYRARG
jgi:hypothetical protein